MPESESAEVAKVIITDTPAGARSGRARAGRAGGRRTGARAGGNRTGERISRAGSGRTGDRSSKAAASTPETAAPEPSAAPSPKMFAARPKPPSGPATIAHTPSDSARFGRVAEDGTVYVREGEGERAVGSYPGASATDALQYFARKYDELYAAADLLPPARGSARDVTSKDLTEGLSGLRTHIGEANVVGDLAALTSVIEGIEAQIVGPQGERGRGARRSSRRSNGGARGSCEPGRVDRGPAAGTDPVESLQRHDALAARCLEGAAAQRRAPGQGVRGSLVAALFAGPQFFRQGSAQPLRRTRSHSGQRPCGQGEACRRAKLAASTDWAARPVRSSD